MSIYELMNGAIYNNDLLEAANKLFDFSEKALLEKNKGTIVKVFYEKLIQYSLGDYIWEPSTDNYKIYSGKSAISKFMYLSMPRKETPVKTLKKIGELSLQIQNDFYSPIGEAIGKNKVQKIMSYLIAKYNFADKVFADKPAIICLLEYSNKNYNSECLVLKTDSSLSQHFFLYHLNHNCNVNPIAVFFHELGHALHARYSGSLDVIPSNIISLLKRTCMPKIEELPDYQKAEILADVFSMGLMFESAYEKYDCFTTIHSDDKKVFKLMVEKILNTMN